MRVLLLFAIAMLMTSAAVVAHEPLDEARAIEKLELLGAEVTRDDQLPERPVIEIDFQRSPRVNDKYLYLLRSFPNLTTLNLNFTHITDDGLKELRSLQRLTTLKLSNSRITDAGLKELRGLANLTTLDLSNNPITDFGLAELQGLKNLRVLYLNDTGIGDPGLKEHGNLEHLRMLDISRTRVTDIGLLQLQDLTNLKTIYLYGEKSHADRRFRTQDNSAEFANLSIELQAVVAPLSRGAAGRPHEAA